jgi:PEP-CTERM motif
MRYATLCFAALLTLPASLQAGIIYSVSLNTAPLVGHPAGPFYLAFQLADGSGTGDGNNAAIVSNLLFGGGAASGSPILFGSAFGDLSSTVVLTDSSFPNYFAQAFTPGSSVAFFLDLTTNPDAGIPDEFTVAILDNTLTPIPTTAGTFFDVFVQIDIDSSNPSVTTYPSDTGRLPNGGGQAIDLGTASVQLAAPEPGTLVLLGTALLGLCLLRSRLTTDPAHRAPHAAVLRHRSVSIAAKWNTRYEYYSPKRRSTEELMISTPTTRNSVFSLPALLLGLLTAQATPPEWQRRGGRRHPLSALFLHDPNV